MAEWFKAAVLKTVDRKVRGFESLSLRQIGISAFGSISRRAGYERVVLASTASPVKEVRPRESRAEEGVSSAFVSPRFGSLSKSSLTVPPFCPQRSSESVLLLNGRSNFLVLARTLSVIQWRAMAKVTSKLQVTIPKVLAEKYGIEPGAEIVWSPLADSIRLAPQGKQAKRDIATRLSLFDAATGRQRCRERERTLPALGGDRGWTREELYQRGKPR